MIRITKAEFVTSVAQKSDIIISDNFEYAFVGRSNVGKSSLINSLTNQKKLAITSSMPGRTRLLNYFKIILKNDENFEKSVFFVDLPGYGYHKAGKSEDEKWQELLTSYLQESKNIKRIFLLLDIRQTTEQDLQMFKYLFYYHIPVTLVATKCDKLSKSQVANQVMRISSNFGVGKDNIIPISSESKLNMQKIMEVIECTIN